MVKQGMNNEIEGIDYGVSYDYEKDEHDHTF